MAAQTSAGTTIAITATGPSTYDDNVTTGFPSLTFTTVGEVVDAGEYGRTYNLVTHNPLDSRKTVKKKGSYNDGTMTLQVARDPDDAGQAILVTALDSDNDYYFEVTLQDGTVQYFAAQVLSYTTGVGSADQITNATIQIELTNSIIEV
jgi:hypothetical protein